MVERYSSRINGGAHAIVESRDFVFSYTPSSNARGSSSALDPERDVTPLWVDAMLCAMGAAMFLSNLVVLSQI